MNAVEIPSIHDEFIQAFRAFDYEKMDMLHESVEKVYMSLFERLMNGDIDGFYYEQQPEAVSHNMYLYTRSVKSEGVQKSVIWRRNDRVVRSHGWQYNIDTLVYSEDDKLEKIVVNECMCQACIERRERKK